MARRSDTNAPVEPDRTLLVEHIEVLETISKPIRLRILHQLITPGTVGEIAERLDVPVTRLYYHLNALERVGAVEVVETRKSGARLQRVYRAVATHFQPGPGLIATAHDPGRLAEAVTAVVLDGARLDAVAGLTTMIKALRNGAAEPAGTIGRSMTSLSAANAARLAERIGELVDEMSQIDDPDGEEFAFSFVLFPMVAPVKGEL